MAEKVITSLNATNWNGQFSYNLHPVSLDKAGELATLAGTVVDAVGAELQE